MNGGFIFITLLFGSIIFQAIIKERKAAMVKRIMGEEWIPFEATECTLHMQ